MFMLYLYRYVCFAFQSFIDSQNDLADHKLAHPGGQIYRNNTRASWPWDEIRFETTFFVYFTFMTQRTKSHCLLFIRNAEKRLIRYYFLAAYLKFPYFKNGTFSADT